VEGLEDGRIGVELRNALVRAPLVQPAESVGIVLGNERGPDHRRESRERSAAGEVHVVGYVGEVLGYVVGRERVQVRQV